MAEEIKTLSVKAFHLNAVAKRAEAARVAKAKEANRTKKFRIGGTTFESKDKCKEHLRKVLRSARAGREVAKDTFKILDALAYEQMRSYGDLRGRWTPAKVTVEAGEWGCRRAFKVTLKDGTVEGLDIKRLIAYYFPYTRAERAKIRQDKIDAPRRAEEMNKRIEERKVADVWADSFDVVSANQKYYWGKQWYGEYTVLTYCDAEEDDDIPGHRGVQIYGSIGKDSRNGKFYVGLGYPTYKDPEELATFETTTEAAAECSRLVDEHRAAEKIRHAAEYKLWEERRAAEALLPENIAKEEKALAKKRLAAERAKVGYATLCTVLEQGYATESANVWLRRFKAQYLDREHLSQRQIGIIEDIYSKRPMEQQHASPT